MLKKKRITGESGKRKKKGQKDDEWQKDLVEAGALAPLGDNRQLPFLGDAAHEEENVDVPVSASVASITSANISCVSISSAKIAAALQVGFITEVKRV